MQSRLHPSEKFEKNLNPENLRVRQSGSAAHSPAYSVATEHLPTASKATPPKDMTPEKVKAREAIQREIDERRSRLPGLSGRGKESARSHETGGTNGNGNGHPAGTTNTTAQAINTPPAIHKDGGMSWIEDAFHLDNESRADRDRCDALAEIPRGW